MILRSALLLVLLASFGCESTLFRGEETNVIWVDYDLEDGPPSRDIYRLCQVAMVRAGFPPGPSDESTGRVESGWDINLAPYAYKGFRNKAVVKIEPQPERYHYLLKVRVIKDLNKEPVNTLDIGKADWSRGADDENRAKEVLQHVLAQIRPITGSLSKG